MLERTSSFRDTAHHVGYQRDEADDLAGQRPHDSDPGTGGNRDDLSRIRHPLSNLPHEIIQGTSSANRYHGPPTVMIQHPNGTMTPAPFLMSRDDVAAFFRLHDSKTKFPDKTIQRYRHMGLRAVRVGRRVWFRLDDVLRFMDQQQDRRHQA